MRLPVLLAVLLAQGAAAQVVTSTGPAKVSVTVYRDPERRGAIQREWLDGYALITETRQVTIPAGRATIRFEGVAGGILPATAIITGLPAGVREKNLDADLLSPRTLYQRSLGTRVSVRRTDHATGTVRVSEAVIRSGAGGAAVIESAEGVEAVGCTGLSEAIVYDGVPPGLSPRPTLSVETDSTASAAATVTLSYLAGGFDWQANYVAQLSDDGTRADLFAWATLASTDVTSFTDASTQLIAGKPNREEDPDGIAPTSGGLSLRCWSVGSTSTSIAPPAPPAPMFAPAPALLSEDIIVTASRVARQEELGDLKLYRVPQPVTVAANSQKQVALLNKVAVPIVVETVIRLSGDDAVEPRLVLRARNRARDGLGLPLPAGPIAVFQPAGSTRLLLGESRLDDRAVGEDVEIDVAAATLVSTDLRIIDSTNRVLTLRNAAANARLVEVVFQGYRHRPIKGLRGLRRRGGDQIWRGKLAANGTISLRYRVG